MGTQLDPQSTQRVFVTGATGFIGGRLTRGLLERNHTVYCLVRNSACASRLRALGARVVLGDVTDPNHLQQALEESRPAIVFHLAGLVRAQCSAEFMAVNAVGVGNIAAACSRCTPPPVLVIASSLAAAGPSDVDVPRTENDTPEPVSNYGRSKLAGEHAAARYADVVPITVVRPPVVFGPADQAVLEIFRTISRWRVHVVPGWKKRSAAGMRLSLIHVDDLVEALLLAAHRGERMSSLTSNESGQGVYFIADDEQPTYAELGRAIATALERNPPTIVRVPSPLLRLIGIGSDVVARLQRRLSWISRDKVAEALAGSWTCSAAKARTQLGWSPGASLANRLRDTVRWYRQTDWL